MQQKKIHNLIVLDESGSMQSIKRQIIDGFNELIAGIQSAASEFREQEHFVSFYVFNSIRKKFMLYQESVAHLRPLSPDLYQPSSGTPLFDALGFALTWLKSDLNAAEDNHVLVTILTDGAENDSKEYDGRTIRSLIQELSQQNWTFTYIGTDHDVDAITERLSIRNKMNFSKDEGGIKRMFEADKNARHRYYDKIQRNEQKGDDYFDEDSKEE